MKINLRPVVHAAKNLKQLVVNLHNSPYYKVLRVRQWLKNGALFIPILFGGRLFEPQYFNLVLISFIIFCALSSGTYILNDLTDIPYDREHPLKKNRPIPSGKISVATAQTMAVALIILPLILAFIVDTGFFVVAAAYVVTMILYSLVLKQIPIIDVLIVAFGFVLRVFAGSFISNTSVSALLILTTIFTALFISFAKRRAEVTLLVDHARDQRKVFKDYPIFLVDKYLTITFGAAFITYSFYTYQAGIRTTSKLLSSFLPLTLSNPNWMMLTIPIIFYALSRYMYLIYEKKEGDAPENVILTDGVLLGTAATWLAMIILFLYGLPLI